MHLRSILLVVAATLAAAGGADAADLAAGKAAAEPCAACHGPAGISTTERVPSLAGQPDQFTQWQLVYYRSGTRNDEVMEALATDLSDADIRNLGAYYASLPPPTPPQDADTAPALTQRGGEIIAGSNCGSCHQEHFAGQQATARLANQREEYLLKALQDFKSGARRGGGVGAMPAATYRLSDDDMAALAHYLARVK
jgi:cytochrome c553